MNIFKNKLALLISSLVFVGLGLLSWYAFPNKKVDTDQTLRINFSRRPLTLDTRKTCDYISSTLETLLFEGLMRVTDSGVLVPGIASRYEISKDQLTYTFYLRDAYWSDGELITAYDFERTWKEILSPSFPSQSPFLLYSIVGAQEAKKGELPLDEVGIEVIDDKTLVVQLKNPTPYFLDLTAFSTFYPVPASMKNEVDEIASFDPSSFVCNGPFILKEFKTASHYTLEKNPHYWANDEVILDSIDISLIADDSTAYSMFQTGKLDILGMSFSQIPRDAVPHLRNKGALNIVPISATSMVQFNTQKYPFNNENMRKAIGYAIDRTILCDHVTQMDEKIASGIVSNYRDGRAYEGKDPFYNPSQAKEYLQRGLEELGITVKDLKPIKYLYTPSDQNKRLVASISNMISENLGIKIQTEGQDFQIFLSKLRKKDFEMCQTAWISQFDDPMNILDRFRTKDEATNDTGWENEEYAELLKKADFSVTREERLDYMRAAEAIFLDEMPQAPIFHWNFAYIKQPNVQNIQTTPIGLPVISRVYKSSQVKEKT